MSVYVGADIGHSETKIVWSGEDGKAKLQPIVQSRVTATQDVEQFPDGFTMLTGNADWVGKSWILSDGAMGKSISTVSLEQGKPKYALPIMLASLFPHLKDGDTIHYCGAVHLSNVSWHEALSNAVSGSHTIAHKSEVKTVTIQPFRILLEGQGAIAFARSQGVNANPVWCLDFGGGTVLGSIFAGIKPKDGCEPYALQNKGVNHLIAELRKDFGTACDLTVKPEHDIIRGILAGQIKEMDGISPEKVQRIVDYRVNDWLDGVFADFHRDAALHIQQARQKVAFGGGCLIGAVAKRLTAEGYTILKKPQVANAYGLHGLVYSKVGVKG
ncbi:MAG: hypothetical protein H7Z11_16980 [Verrucomicrobia bacterium]|nr:hypothetical protein [Leptolyngbya sp. ES-bin-22]